MVAGCRGRRPASSSHPRRVRPRHAGLSTKRRKEGNLVGAARPGNPLALSSWFIRRSRCMNTSGTRKSVTRRTALAGLGAGGLGVALAASVRTAAAQDATAAGPLVGTWQWGAAAGLPEPIWFAIFHADGTF